MKGNNIYTYWFLFSLMVISEAARLTVRDQNCKCGIRQEKVLGTRIFGGTAADPNEFPWQVLLEISNAEGKFRCGGSLISDRSEIII